MTIEAFPKELEILKSQIPKARIIREKWFRGQLEFKLHEGQKLIDRTYKSIEGQLFVGNCSRQWGKSFWAVQTAISLAIRKPRAQIRYGAAFHTDLVEFIIPAFDKIIEDCPESIRPVYKKQGSSYIFPNGSRIKLVGLDRKPNGLRGNTLDLIIIDECGFVTNLDYIYKSVIIPATTHRPNCKIIMISTPPSTPAHPFVDYVQRAISEGAYGEFNIYQNPMITPDTIQRLMKESGGEKTTTWRREYLCEFVTDSDLCIVPEWKDDFIQEIERDEFFRYYHKYVGMDLGVKDFTAAIFGYYDFKRASLIIEDEFKTNGPSLNTEILVAMIRSKEKELWGEGESDEKGQPTLFEPFRRISDNNWPLLMNDFSYLHNLTFIQTNKDLLEAMINELRIFVQNGRLIVHPRCEMLTGALKFGVWDSKKKQFARSTVYGHFDHLSALVYLVRNLAQNTNPIPANHGHETHRSWTLNIDKQNKSQNIKTLEKVFVRKSTKHGL